MYLKHVKSIDSTGYRLKICFENEDEYIRLIKNIEENVPGLDSNVTRVSEQLLDFLEKSYVVKDESEKDETGKFHPSTYIPDYAITNVFPLFCLLVDQKATDDSQAIDRSKYISLDKYNALMIEYDKLDTYIKNFNSNPPEIIAESNRSKEALEAIKKENDWINKQYAGEIRDRAEFLELLSGYFESIDTNEITNFVKNHDEKEIIGFIDTKQKQFLKASEETRKKLTALKIQEKQIEQLQRELAEAKKNAETLEAKYKPYVENLNKIMPVLQQLKENADQVATFFIDDLGKTKKEEGENHD